MNKVFKVPLMGYFLAISVAGYSQPRLFFDKATHSTDSAQSYYYSITYRNIQKIKSNPNSGDKTGWLKIKTDSIVSFYTATGKIKERKKMIDSLLNGNMFSFYENGRIHERKSYNRGEPYGIFNGWYENGTTWRIINYTREGENLPTFINYWDSLGQQIVKDGFGYCNCYDMLDEGSVLREQGKVVNGLRDSIWQSSVNGRLISIKHYDAGFLLGFERDLSNDSISSSLDEMPSFI